MLSDCGTNFVGAMSEELKTSHVITSKDYKETLSRELEEFQIEWKFSPSYSPHFGGIREANLNL